MNRHQFQLLQLHFNQVEAEKQFRMNEINRGRMRKQYSFNQSDRNVSSTGISTSSYYGPYAEKEGHDEKDPVVLAVTRSLRDLPAYEEPRPWSHRYQDVSMSGTFQFTPLITLTKLLTLEADYRILIRDIRELLIYNVGFGLDTKTAVSMLTPEMRERHIKLRHKYKVASGNPQFATDITIARIQATFPRHVSRLLSQGYGRVIGELGNLPRALAFPSGGSLIPRDEAYYGLWHSWRMWAERYVQTMGLDVTPDQLERYCMAALNTPIYTNAARREILAEWNIIPPGVYVRITRRASDCAKKFVHTALQRRKSLK